MRVGPGVKAEAEVTGFARANVSASACRYVYLLDDPDAALKQELCIFFELQLYSSQDRRRTLICLVISAWPPSKEGRVAIPTWTCIAGRSQFVKSLRSMTDPSTSGAFFRSCIVLENKTSFQEFCRTLQSKKWTQSTPSKLLRMSCSISGRYSSSTVARFLKSWRLVLCFRYLKPCSSRSKPVP